MNQKHENFAQKWRAEELPSRISSIRQLCFLINHGVLLSGEKTVQLLFTLEKMQTTSLPWRPPSTWLPWRPIPQEAIQLDYLVTLEPSFHLVTLAPSFKEAMLETSSIPCS